MRSSIWNTCTLFQGTSSPASARSMIHGVCPPLTAIMKRPRAATAARASAAMVAAAARATDSSSSNTSNFMPVSPLRNSATLAHSSSTHRLSSSFGQGLERLHLRRRRILPATCGRDLSNLARSPGIRIVFVNRRDRLQHGINDPPRLFHVVLASELRGVSRHGVSQQPLISFHLPGPRSTADDHFDGLTCYHLAGRHDRCAESDRNLGTDPKPQMIAVEFALPDHRGRLP